MCHSQLETPKHLHFEQRRDFIRRWRRHISVSVREHHYHICRRRRRWRRRSSPANAQLWCVSNNKMVTSHGPFFFLSYCVHFFFLRFARGYICDRFKPNWCTLISSSRCFPPGLYQKKKKKKEKTGQMEGIFNPKGQVHVSLCVMQVTRRLSCPIVCVCVLQVRPSYFFFAWQLKAVGPLGCCCWCWPRSIYPRADRKKKGGGCCCRCRRTLTREDITNNCKKKNQNNKKEQSEKEFARTNAVELPHWLLSRAAPASTRTRPLFPPARSAALQILSNVGRRLFFFFYIHSHSLYSSFIRSIDWTFLLFFISISYYCSHTDSAVEQ